MSNLALQKQQVEYSITILSGPDKGEVFKLMSTTVTIGRSSTNDIVLDKDHKCSRQHAEINISSTGIIIKSLNPKNLVSVDGKEGPALPLGHNAKVKIGSTKILFQISVIVEDEAQAPAIYNNPMNNPLGPSRAQEMPKKKPKKKNQAKSNNNFRIILIGVIVILVLFVLTDDPNKGGKSTGIRTEEEIDKEIETLNQLRDAERKLREKKGTNTAEFRKAQSHYITGFRDYKKGKFERAIASFQACTSIFPEHDLCKTYLKLSTKRYQEVIQYHMITGRKYLDKGQYSACIVSFKNVMHMVRDKTSKVYKEADAQRKLCDYRLRGRY